MISVLVVILLLVLHYLGDFVFQSHYMSQHKSTNNKVLLGHVSAYSMVLLFGTMIFFAVTKQTVRHGHLWVATFLPLYTVVNGVLHFCTDYVTSRISSAMWQNAQWHNFFLVVGTDQLIHVSTLVLTWHWMAGN